MKKIIITSLMFLFLLTSCGIDPCYCLRGYEGYGLMNNMTISETKKCISKYGKDIPDSYRGTKQFTDAMISELRKECKK